MVQIVIITILLTLLILVLIYIYNPINITTHNKSKITDNNDDLIQPLQDNDDDDDDDNRDALSHRINELQHESGNKPIPSSPSPLPLLSLTKQVSTGDITNDECQSIEKQIDNYKDNNMQIGIEGSTEHYLRHINM